MRRRTFLFLALFVFLPSAFGSGESNDAALKKSYELEALKNYENSIRVLTPMYNANPRAFFTNLRLAWLNYLNGNYKNALTHYDAALKAQNKSATALFGKLQVLTIQARWSEAKQVAKTLTNLMPSDYNANLRLAQIYIGSKEYTEAVATLSHILPLFSESVELLNTLAWAQKYSGDKAGAARTLKRALSFYPENAIALEYLRELEKKK